MSLDTILFIIFIVVVIFGGAVKKLLDKLQEQLAAQNRGRVDYEASPEQITDFLDSLRAGQKPQVREQEAPVVGGLREAMARPEPPRPMVAPPGPLSSMGREAPPARARVAVRGRPRGRAQARSGVVGRKEKQPALPPQARKAAAVTPLALRGTSLRQAVIWSEILGPPVSMRRRRPRPPRETP